MIKKAWDWLVDAVEGRDDPDEVVYDPVHVAAVVVGCLGAIGALFWLLWAMLVFEGGVFVKAGPLLQVLFTSRTLKDFGYEGAPHAMGVFEGWAVNAAALLAAAALVIGVWWVLQPKERKR